MLIAFVLVLVSVQFALQSRSALGAFIPSTAPPSLARRALRPVHPASSDESFIALLYASPRNEKDDGEDGRDAILPRPSVLCGCDALFDCIANDDARGLSVDEMMRQNSWTAFPGGAAANAAVALCKLGTRSAFAGCVGLDDDGDALKGVLREAGVDVTLLRRAGQGIPTRRVMVTRTWEGDRAFGGFYGGRPPDVFADCYLDAASLMDEESDRVVKGIEWAVCGTLSLAYDKSADAMRSLVRRCTEAGAKLCVDVNWRPVFWPADAEERARREILDFARQAQMVKLTDEEAEWLLGVPMADTIKNPSLVRKEFPDSFAVFVTAGEKGASFSMLEYEGFVEPFQVDVTETTGAGDAFTAGLLHGLLSSGWDVDSFSDKVPLEEQSAVIKSLVRFAAAVGALTCTKEGAIAAQPTYEEVESFLVHGEKVWI